MKLLQKTIGPLLGTLALAFSCTASADTMYDLTSAGAAANIGGAVFTQVAALPTGTGYIDSFVRLRANQALIEGYNTTVNNVFQNDSSDTFNHEITLGQIGFIDLNGPLNAGGIVMRFLLDINQTKTSSHLSLDDVQIYISKTPNQSTTNVPSLGRLVYGMDTATDNRVELDYALNNGSGSGDMTLDIPIEMFLAAFGSGNGYDTADDQNGAYIYLYSKFGSVNGNNDGFEEWTHYQGTPIGEPPCNPAVQDCGPREIPEPSALALISLGLLGSVVAGRFNRRRWERRQ